MRLVDIYVFGVTDQLGDSLITEIETYQDVDILIVECKVVTFCGGVLKMESEIVAFCSVILIVEFEMVTFLW